MAMAQWLAKPTEISINGLNYLIGKVPLYFPLLEIHVRRKTFYKNCPVYIIQFENCFMRLFIFKDQIYQNHCFMRPANPLRYLGYMIHFLKCPYGADEMEEGEKAILNEAIDSIDYLDKVEKINEKPS